VERGFRREFYRSSSLSYTVPRPGDTDNVLLQKILLALSGSDNLALQNILLDILAAINGSAVINDFFSDTAAHPGDWTGLHAVTDCDIAAITFSAGSGSIAGIRIACGDRIEGSITSIQLDAGTIRMIRQ
jgi:hypothetical protein